MRKIKINAPDLSIELDVKVLDNPIAAKIIKALPVESTAQRWGEEIYFDTGIDVQDHQGTLDIEIGDIAYWPQGRCLCVFFGPTPASISEKPVPASEVIVVGKVKAIPASLRKVKSGAKIRVE